MHHAPLRALALGAMLFLIAPIVPALVPAPHPAPLAAGADPQDWPVYGHDLWDTREAPAFGAPQAPALLWSTDLGGDIAGTPAVAGGVVYAGTFAGAVAAVDAATGHVLWSTPVDGAVTSSVAVSGGQVYYSDLKGHLGALDAATGARAWTTDLGFGMSMPALYGSPIPVAGKVLVGTSSDEEQDQAGGMTYDFRGALVAVDATTGAIAWTTFFAQPGEVGAAAWTTPAVDVATGTVYIGTGNAYVSPPIALADSVVALDLADGHVKWHQQFWEGDVWTLGNQLEAPDYDFGASPNLFLLDGRLVVGEGQKSGDYHVLDAATGERLWDARLTSGSSLGGFLGTTAVADGRIFAGVLSSASPMDHRVPAPAVAPLVAPMGGKYMAFDAATGALEQLYPTAPTLSAAAVSGGRVFQGDLSGTLWIRDAATGLPLHAFPTGEPIQSGPALSRGVAYFGSGTAMGAPTGHHLWALRVG